MNDNELEAVIDELETMATTKRAKSGRPKKLTAKEWDCANIEPVANGYVVTSPTTGKNIFVFGEIEEAVDFIKSKLKPTAEQSEFLTKV